MAQIGLYLSIAIGAQLGLTNKQISILAGVNTGVAAIISILKGLGLLEKAILERQRLRKVAERIHLTIRKLKVGIDVNTVKEADEVQILEDTARDNTQINFAGLETANKGERN
uniref:SMODS and SLOG-associating 2TM effector domain-containing protein n=1 Tax=Bionectria ochroleuca TaxID=29856 RepID=A0A8H7N1X0_BIOOC